MENLSELLAQLTLEEKTSLLSGNGMWNVPGVPRLGIPSIKVTDGPNGARGAGLLGSGIPALCIPCGSALGATWNRELIERVGAAVGEESRSKASHVLLAPTINIHRSPLGGRNFECYSEDPLLTGKIAAAFIRGVQSQGVACTPKHLAGNDAEFERTTINSLIDERTLREIYLRPFEIAIKEGKAWGLMGAYNRLNGDFCCEHPWLLDQVLKQEWQFDGVVVSDWFATRSTRESAMAGLDLEMPGTGRMWGDGKLADAAKGDPALQARIDDMALRMLRLMQRTRAFEDPMDHEEQSIDRPEHRALAREAACEATVLLKNEGVLPFDRKQIRRLAVIGPNADRAQIMGGGSANLRPFHFTTPLDALRESLGESMEIVYERGCSTDKTPPVMKGPIEVTVYDGLDLDGDVIEERSYDQSKVMVFGHHPKASDGTSFSLRARWRFTAQTSGPHEFCAVVASWTRILVDGEVVIDAWRPGVERGTDLFGLGSVELSHTLDLSEGQTIAVEVECSSQDSIILTGFQLGCRLPENEDALERAAAVASEADAVVLVVGTNDDWESEGHDRTSMDLPGRSDELVRAVTKANPNTVVVLNAGSPLTLPWIDEAKAVLDIWFGGQEMGAALCDILFGGVSPSGKLPTTFPRRLEHNPSFVNFPGENSELRYGEGIFVGYRYYDTTDRDPLFCFGHGLSYTSFELATPRLGATSFKAGDILEIEVDVTNTGKCRAAEVVQIYLAPDAPLLARPAQELVAFEKVWLDPGESTTVRLRLDERSFSYWDPGDCDFERLSEGLPVPAGGGRSRRSDAGWVSDPGLHHIHIGVSSRDIRHRCEIQLD